MKNILLIIFICLLNQLSAQEKVGMKDLYVENDLTYKVADDKLFSGQAQKIRKNDHLVFEQYFEKGIQIKSILYFNRTKTPTPASEIYYHAKTSIPKKGISFYLDGSQVDYEYYDSNGEKILEERYEGKTLIYKCKFVNGKKQGIEYCLLKDGTEFRIEYRNGKKVKK